LSLRAGIDLQQNRAAQPRDHGIDAGVLFPHREKFRLHRRPSIAATAKPWLRAKRLEPGA
jgi:hypothetical protein